MEAKEFFDKWVKICKDHSKCDDCPCNSVCVADPRRVIVSEKLVKKVENYSDETTLWFSPDSVLRAQIRFRRKLKCFLGESLNDNDRSKNGQHPLFCNEYNYEYYIPVKFDKYELHYFLMFQGLEEFDFFVEINDVKKCMDMFTRKVNKVIHELA